jgi:hypothetical protein
LFLYRCQHIGEKAISAAAAIRQPSQAREKKERKQGTEWFQRNFILKEKADTFRLQDNGGSGIPCKTARYERFATSAATDRV